MGPSCSKLVSSLVSETLNIEMFMYVKHCHFMLKNMRGCCSVKTVILSPNNMVLCVLEDFTNLGPMTSFSKQCFEQHISVSSP